MLLTFLLVYIKNKQSWMLTTVVRIDFSHSNYYIREEESPVWAELNFTKTGVQRIFSWSGVLGERPMLLLLLLLSHFGCVGLCVTPTLYQIPGGHSKNLGSALKALCTGYLQGLQHLVRTFYHQYGCTEFCCVLFFLNIFM